MLQVTEALIYTQKVVIERDHASPDAFGAAVATEWEVLSTVPCRAWWWKGSKSSDKSPSAQYARPQTSINVTGGDMSVPLGTDVTDLDRVGALLDSAGNVIEEGPFRVIAVNPYEDHIELSLERP